MPVVVEETDEYQFVYRAVELLQAENLRPDKYPGGVWRYNFASGPVEPLSYAGRLTAAICDIQPTWGIYSEVELPVLRLFNNVELLNGPHYLLCHDFPARLALWRTAWRNRRRSPVLANLDFRKVVLISAILGCDEEEEEDQEP